MVILCLIFWGTTKLYLHIGCTSYIPISSELHEESNFSTSFANTFLFLILTILMDIKWSGIDFDTEIWNVYAAIPVVGITD